MHVTTYDTYDDMMDTLGDAMEAADDATKSWQKLLRVGDYYMAHTEYGFDIYGEVLQEYEEEHMLNYRFTKSYSVACPEGELGDVHVCTIAAILDREQFEKAREDSWQ